MDISLLRLIQRVTRFWQKPNDSARRCFGIIHGFSTLAVTTHLIPFSLSGNLLIDRDENIIEARTSAKSPPES
ncbi:unnamed protein product [Cylicocyclus nassatus]|uniref:Uncharacterized protein n=1 Tax=Cylicocyclus nassatus TaxID=53992 RepID=A0AA36DL17_CYLNA|nr:unnamed protein product [Cylicocyclus nassatus]